jgi:hypothetical protein
MQFPSRSISEDEYGSFLCELTDILSSNLASFGAEDQLAIYVMTRRLLASSVSKSGGTCPPHPPSLASHRCDLATEDIHFQSAALADDDTDEFLYSNLGHLAHSYTATLGT